MRLQQYLPFTVLKRLRSQFPQVSTDTVATVLTVYGIETGTATALIILKRLKIVATVLTVYGIET